MIRRTGVQSSSGEKASPNKEGPPQGQLTWQAVQTWGEADRRTQVTCIDVISSSMSKADGMATVLVGRKNGRMNVIRVDRLTGMLDTSTVVTRDLVDVKGRNMYEKDDGGTSISAIHGVVLPSVADVESGRPGGEGTGHLEREDDGMLVCVVTRNGIVRFYDMALENELGQFSCPPQVTCAAYHAPSRQLAIGCEGAELKVYTLEWQEEGKANTKKPKLDGKKVAAGESHSTVSGTLTYSAKGGKPDKVGFCDKPWNSAIVFNPTVEYGSQIIVATGHGKLRLYDTKVGKRPQLNVPFQERRITSLSPDTKHNVWWVADAEGNMQSYDVKAGKFQGAIKGVSGSIRSTDIHPTLPFIVSGGLDRYVRIHSTRTRTAVMRLYMTSQLCVVRWLGSQEEEAPPGDTEKNASKRTKKGKKRKA